MATWQDLVDLTPQHLARLSSLRSAEITLALPRRAFRVPSTGTGPAIPWFRIEDGSQRPLGRAAMHKARLVEVLLGALLALWHTARPPLAGRGQRTAIALGDVGLVGTLVFWFAVSERTHWLWQGGFSLYALITCPAILGAVQPTGPALRLLGWGPFPWLGKVSYGVYLYHFPAYVTLAPELMGLERWPLFVVRIGVNFALATTSYYLLEMPIRQERLVTGWRPWLVLPASVAVASLSLVVATIDPPLRRSIRANSPKPRRKLLGRPAHRLRFLLVSRDLCGPSPKPTSTLPWRCIRIWKSGTG